MRVPVPGPFDQDSLAPNFPDIIIVGLFCIWISRDLRLDFCCASDLFDEDRWILHVLLLVMTGRQQRIFS